MIKRAILERPPVGNRAFRGVRRKGANGREKTKQPRGDTEERGQKSNRRKTRRLAMDRERGASAGSQCKKVQRRTRL